MKFISVAIVIAYISAISAQLAEIDIEGGVQHIEFDSDWNVYVVGSTKFYILDSNKTITLENTLENIYEIFVTKSSNVYIFSRSDSDIESLYFLNGNSKELTKIYEVRMDSVPRHFKDNNDNIFFNTYAGVALVRADETVPTAIVNLEFFTIQDEFTHAIDRYGNIYLGGLNRSKTLKLAVIPEYQIQQTVPYGDVFELPNPILNVLSNVEADWEGNIHVAFAGDQARIYEADTYGFGDAEVAQYLHFYKGFYPTESRFYFFSTDLYNEDCILNFLHQEDIFGPLQFTQIPQKLPSQVCINARSYWKKITSDSNGNLFFTNGTQVFYVKSSETEIKELTFDSGSELEVSGMGVDGTDHLWIVKGSLYVVRNESMVPEQLSVIFTTGSWSVIKFNEKTNDVFINTAGKLFVYTN